MVLLYKPTKRYKKGVSKNATRILNRNPESTNPQNKLQSKTPKMLRRPIIRTVSIN
jgi:hypothetical protein